MQNPNEALNEPNVIVTDTPWMIYVAGPLNAEAVGYLRNVHQMLRFGNMVRWKGHSPYIPSMDLLLGILDGQMNYGDFFDMSQPWLEALAEIRSRPTALWYTAPSPGADQELETACRLRIPVVRDYSEIPFARTAWLETQKLAAEAQNINQNQGE